MIEVCSNKEVEKTWPGSRVWIGGFNRKLETFCLIRSKKETSRIVNEQNSSAFYLSFLGNLSF